MKNSLGEFYDRFFLGAKSKTLKILQDFSDRIFWKSTEKNPGLIIHWNISWNYKNKKSIKSPGGNFISWEFLNRARLAAAGPRRAGRSSGSFGPKTVKSCEWSQKSELDPG